MIARVAEGHTGGRVTANYNAFCYRRARQMSVATFYETLRDYPGHIGREMYYLRVEGEHMPSPPERS